MQHPFAGIILPESSVEPAPESHRRESSPRHGCGRRSFVAAVLGALGGTLSLLSGGKARAEEPYAGPPLPAAPKTPPPRTNAQPSRTDRPDQTAAFPVSQPQAQPKSLATTQALGEEGGNNQVTTYALGEEGSGGTASPPSTPTTFALGEEGNGSRPTTYALGEEGGGGRPTTYALGEEGGAWMRPPFGRPTTFLLGEEGAGRRVRRRRRR